MTHPDPDRLALLALGEGIPTTAEQQHLDDCPACREELAGFERTVAAVRAGEPLAVPGPEVWQGVAMRLGRSDAAEDPLGGSRTAPAAGRRRPARAPRRVVVLVAGAAVLVAAVAGLLLGTGQQPQRLAEARLRAFPAWPGSTGTAVVERLPDGGRVLHVSTSLGAGDATDREVWLMTDGARRLVGLGVLHDGTGTFAVPGSIDLARYHLVDVSDEPRDGDPAHSGDSIVRGTLRS